MPAVVQVGGMHLTPLETLPEVSTYLYTLLFLNRRLGIDYQSYIV